MNIGFVNLFIRETCRDDRRYSYKVTRYPYVRYDRRRFRKYQSLISIHIIIFIFASVGLPRTWIRFSRWMPIFVDRFTRQTIIYSSRGGMNCLI
jgi:hypothetical protein